MCLPIGWGLADLAGLGWLDQRPAVGPAELGSLLQVGLRSAPRGLLLGSRMKGQELFSG